MALSWRLASVQWRARTSGCAAAMSGNWPSTVAAIRPWSCWRRLRSRVLYAASWTSACLKVYSASGGRPRRKMSSALTSCAKASSNCGCGIDATALISSCEKCLPKAAPICATSQTIKPREQGGVEGRWDRQRRQRSRHSIVIASIGKLPALDHCLCQLFDEQRDTVRAINDLVGDLRRQRLTVD